MGPSGPSPSGKSQTEKGVVSQRKVGGQETSGRTLCFSILTSLSLSLLTAIAVLSGRCIGVGRENADIEETDEVVREWERL